MKKTKKKTTGKHNADKPNELLERLRQTNRPIEEIVQEGTKLAGVYQLGFDIGFSEGYQRAIQRINRRPGGRS